MNINNVPKRKKNTEVNTYKRSQSQQLLNKPTKRKPQRKKLQQVNSKSTLARTPSHAKLKKQSQNKMKTKSSNKNNKSLKKKKLQKQKQPNQDKPFQQMCTKTIKKFMKKKKQKQEQLTQRKKIHLEYFMYKDTYVPIQNTQQRKIIFKIQLIDENAQRVRSTKKILNKQTQKDQSMHVQNVQQNQHEKKVVQKQFADKATQPTQRKMQKLINIDFQCQAYIVQQQQIGQKSQSDDKCFAETLSQLQFLYLPDDKNFQGFTKSEKTHYKQLLLYIAKKFQEPETILDQQAVQMIINERLLKQRGVVEYTHKKGIPTHTPSIISYISNLFCYVQLHQKISLIQRINCTYGYYMDQKLKRVKQGKSTLLKSRLIPESTFWRFETQLVILYFIQHQGLNFQSDTIEQCLHAHNRAVFDAVNQILQQFQPYYKTQGEPLPWGYNFQTTFFCISQQSFPALVNQVRDKIYEYSTILAGIHFENDNISYTNGQHRYKIHYNKILTAQQSLIKNEVKSYDDKVQVQQHRTRVMLKINQLILQDLYNQILQQMSI